MFPLGTVLLPGEMLPLQVFEPRYRELVRDCLAGEPEFGVVLILRGSEVGGGDVRSTAGTVARIVQVGETPDGRLVLATVGTRRIRVNAWLPDDPYPQADVDDWPDEPPADGFEDRLAATTARLRRVLALKAELGEPAAPATTEIAADPSLASFAASTLAPLGPADRFDLLVAPGPDTRLRLLDGLLAAAEEVAVLQLGHPAPGGDAPPG